MGIDAYDYGRKDGVAEERQRIADWIEANRRKFEVEAGIYIYRDSFDSVSLLEFIESGKKVGEDE